MRFGGFQLDRIIGILSFIDNRNISLVFGGITCAAGFIGVAIGAELSRRYRSQYPNSDALVCAFGLLSSIPFLFFNLILASKYIYLSYVSGHCINWSYCYLEIHFYFVKTS